MHVVGKVMSGLKAPGHKVRRGFQGKTTPLHRDRKGGKVNSLMAILNFSADGKALRARTVSIALVRRATLVRKGSNCVGFKGFLALSGRLECKELAQLDHRDSSGLQHRLHKDHRAGKVRSKLERKVRKEIKD